MAVDPEVARLFAGRIVDLTFRSSFWDEPVRPVFRFWQTPVGFVDEIGTGPVCGLGTWTGRIPGNTVAISVSPTNRVGRFDFRLDQVRARSWTMLLLKAMARRPKPAFAAIVARLIGWRAESDANFARATQATHLQAFAAWRASRSRALDLDGIDRPRFDWAKGVHIKTILHGDDDDARRKTLVSISAQVYPNWSVECATATTLSAGGHGTAGTTFTLSLAAGDVLAPYAFACVAEQAERYPACPAFYGDFLRRSDSHVSPIFLDPAAAQRPGAPVFRREHDRNRSGGLVSHRTISCRPLRRMLMETGHDVPETTPDKALEIVTQATVAAIIPTKDNPTLLRRVIASIEANSAAVRPQIIVVDNGSVTSEAHDVLSDLAGKPHVSCLTYRGAFNFSAMCNLGASSARAAVLVFLNDDTRVLQPDWLVRLVGAATRPDVGAVGARLVYPDGRLQHDGIVIGMDGSAGHYDASSRYAADGPQRAVSAVTGACLAVERWKFDAVGGFDAEALPVEFGDVDLCLKLNARQWQTVIDEGVRIVHEESASRGRATFRRLAVYAAQRNTFIERWRHVMRDDPFFHPALSLRSRSGALG